MRKEAQNKKEHRREILALEDNEARVFYSNLDNLMIDEVIAASEVGTKEMWDFKYRRGSECVIANAKVIRTPSTEPFSLQCYNRAWSENLIDGHAAKVSVLQDLYRIGHSERIDIMDEYHGFKVPITTHYRPTMIWFFQADGIALEYYIDELGLAWDPVGLQFIDNGRMVDALCAKTQAREDRSVLERKTYYGLRPDRAKRIWKVSV